MKYGDGALKGASGIHEHIVDVNAYLAVPGNLAALKEQMLGVFNQKRALGLIEWKKNLTGFSGAPPVLLLVLANHDRTRPCSASCLARCLRVHMPSCASPRVA